MFPSSSSSSSSSSPPDSSDSDFDDRLAPTARRARTRPLANGVGEQRSLLADQHARRPQSMSRGRATSTPFSHYQSQWMLDGDTGASHTQRHNDAHVARERRLRRHAEDSSVCHQELHERDRFAERATRTRPFRRPTKSPRQVRLTLFALFLLIVTAIVIYFFNAQVVVAPPTPAPPTPAPTPAPPTPPPTTRPTRAPTSAPTTRPTRAPTSVPTTRPTPAPTTRPTPAPTAVACMARRRFVDAPTISVGDRFGSATSISCNGSISVVGAPNIGDNRGGAFIYQLDIGTGVYSQLQRMLFNGDPDARDCFGSSVAVSCDGSIVAVGAEDEEIENRGTAGAVYVYRYDELKEEYVSLQRIDATVRYISGSQRFGSSLALSHDATVMLVGARGENGNAGAVYEYRWNGTSYLLRQRIQGSTTDKSDNFGAALSLSGDGRTAIIGAYLDEVESVAITTDPTESTEDYQESTDAFSGRIGAESGTAFVFVDNSTHLVETQRIDHEPDAAEFDFFGWSVDTSVDGARIVVGARNQAMGTDDRAGAVYVFQRDGPFSLQASYTRLGALFRSSINADERFGSSVALSDDASLLVVGARSEVVDNALTNAGAVYVYRVLPAGTAYALSARVTNGAVSQFRDEHFGSSVAVSADGVYFIVGAPVDERADAALGTRTGSVFAYCTDSVTSR